MADHAATTPAAASTRLDPDHWWTLLRAQADTPVGQLIDGLDTIADQLIPYGWLPVRARSIYGADAVVWADLAAETITTLVSRPRSGENTVRDLLYAAHLAAHRARHEPTDAPSDPAAIAERLLARLPDYDRAVLRARSWALEPQSIPETARTLGVAAVNIHRNQPRAHARFSDLLNEPAHRPLLDCATALGEQLGPITDEAAAAEALHERGLRIDSDAAQMMLHLAGPYARTGGWLENVPAEGLATAAAAVEAALDEYGAPTTAAVTLQLQLLGIPAATAAQFIDSRPQLRRFGDRWVRWGTSTGDRTEAALHLLGRPATLAEIAETISEHCRERSVREVLHHDNRFLRVTRHTWALRQWGHPEYGGLFTEIADRIDAAGGVIGVEDLVTDMTTDFPDIAAKSVRAVLRAPGFVANRHEVRRRTDADGWPPVPALQTISGVYRRGRNEIRVALPVTDDLLRGSGQLAHPALATALGVNPGQRRTFTGKPTAITVFWRLSTTNGAALGSLRPWATALGAQLGDQIVLAFNTKHGSVAATVCAHNAAPSQRLAALLGKPPHDRVAALARALTCKPRDVAALLQRRGELELLSADTS